MAGESKNDVVETVTSTDTKTKTTNKKKGVLSRVWNAIFRVQGDDFEKRLQHISKEETAILARVARRSQSWRRMAWQLILFSVFFEVIAVGYAIMATRSLNLNWKMRALRVLPIILLPALSFITYSALGSYTRMRDRKDHKTLEKLRAERQAKIDELKEKTNYYITQQLIQRYDPDPAAKAAAATVLASKLGADSGLKVYLGDESKVGDPTGKSNDVEVAKTSGLRNRKPSHSKSSSMENVTMRHSEEGMVSHAGFEGSYISEQQRKLVVEHGPQAGLGVNDGGWIARLAALLVGDDPTQSYALICGNCHMHNGLARKEEFPYITYYCPHCKALNGPKQSNERNSRSNSPTIMPSIEKADVIPSAGGETIIAASNSPPEAAVAGISDS